MNPETRLIIGLCAAILFYSCGLFAYQQSVDAVELEAALKSPNVQTGYEKCVGPSESSWGGGLLDMQRPIKPGNVIVFPSAQTIEPADNFDSVISIEAADATFTAPVSGLYSTGGKRSNGQSLLRGLKSGNVEVSQ